MEAIKILGLIVICTLVFYFSLRYLIRSAIQFSRMLKKEFSKGEMVFLYIAMSSGIIGLLAAFTSKATTAEVAMLLFGLYFINSLAFNTSNTNTVKSSKINFIEDDEDEDGVSFDDNPLSISNDHSRTRYAIFDK